MTKASETRQRKPLMHRLVALLIVMIMLVGEFAMLPIPKSFAAGNSGNTLLMNQYSSDLYIYNYLCYTSGAGTVETASGNSFILKGASNVNVTVGDVVGAEGEARPIDHDIQLQLNALSFSAGKKITVNPIYNGRKTLAITVTGASHIDTLVIKSGAKATITLQADLEIGAITLEAGASLEIRTGNKTVTVPSILGEGDLTVSGGGFMNCETVSVGKLTLTNTTLNGGGSGRITAKGDISVGGATLEDFSLFGYGSDAEGIKTISLNGCHFSSVETVGAEEGANATVTLKGTVASALNTTYIFDYLITYTAGGTKLTPEADWPTAYRVRHDSLTGGVTEIIGYIANNAFVNNATVTLPTYDTDFFGYDGWELEGVSITSLSPTQRGDITLDAILRAGTVTVDMILGYSPSELTNDLPLPLDHQTLATAVGEVIELATPTRFGYVFKGWRITSGSLHGIHTGSYTVAAEDLDVIADSDAFSLTMEVVWEADKFPLRLSLGAQIDASYLSISFDGVNFVNFNTYVTTSLPSSVSYHDKTLSFSDYIVYGESLGDYFTRIFGGYPILRDNTNDYTFASWYNTENGASVAAGDLYQYGDGIIVRHQDETLTSLQRLLKELPIGFAPLWVKTTQEYTLKVENATDWVILVNGEQKTPDADGNISVTLGSNVSLRASASSKFSISHWQIDGVSTVTERSYAAGAAFLYYDFTMPPNDVTAIGHKQNDATNGTEILVDLVESPITFAQNVSYNNRKHSGFWSDVRYDHMTPLFDEDGRYFYIWNFAEPFYVTTYNKPTTNQLTIVSEMTGGIYLRDCKLVARDEYLNAAVGRELGGSLIEAGTAGKPTALNNNTDWSAYPNIVLNNRTNPLYTTTLHIRGTNTVASIMPSHFNGTSAYTSTLYVKGESRNDSFLTLGSVLNLGKLYLEKLNVTEYDDNFDYLLYTCTAQMNRDNIDIKESVITAPNKRLYNSYNYLDIRNSDIDIGSVFVAYSLRLYNSSYVRVRGDVIGHYYLIDVAGTSSLVVDGGVYTRSGTNAYGNGNITTSGYVIVKGNGIVGTGLSVTGNATIIANMIGASRGSTFAKGVIVTNFISNPVTQAPAVQKNGQYNILPYTSSTANGADCYPFYSYSNTRNVSSEFLFSGSAVYLFGYHKTSGRVFDTSSHILNDPNNPLGAIVTPLLDAKGDLLSSLRQTPNTNAVASAAEAAIQTAVTNGLYQTSECFGVGDSRHTEASIYAKSVRISGGKIYACGNMNFFNAVTVTGGTVLSGGRFGSKHDILISGGQIAASEIGISSNLTVSENGLVRYSKLALSGGTVMTARLGSHSVSAAGETPKGVLDLAIGATITPYLTPSVTIASSLYANYLFDSATYQVGAGNPVALDLIGAHNGTAITEMALAGEITLVSPTLKSGSGSAMWLYDNAGGEKITSVAANGLVNGDEVFATYVYDSRLCFAVYAAKGSYILSIKGNYQDTGFDVSYDGTNYDKNTSFSVNAGDTVTIHLDNLNVYDRTIVWYTDAAGIIHNALKTAGATLDSATKTITFRMPYSDTEIFITSEFTLNLNLYNISFTESGFALEEASASRREDSLFDYKGHILIAQTNTSATNNRIIFETAESGNADSGRRITLYQLNQSSLGALYGTTIADGADVILTIKHAAGKKCAIAPIYLPVNASIKLVGQSANAADNNLSFYSYLSLGSYTCIGSEKAGVITYENLTILNEANSYASLASTQTAGVISPNTATFRNCIFTESGYYTYDVIAQRMNAVVFDGCSFSITGSSDVSSPLVKECNTLTITDSTIYFTYGGTRSGYHIFSSVKKTVTVHNSVIDVHYNRAENSSKTYLEENGAQGNVTVSGNSVLNFDYRISFISLVLCDDAVLNVTDGVSDGVGYLFCPNITLRDNATIKAGYVFVSGYAVGAYIDKQAVLSALQSGSAIDGASYNGLLVEGGTLRALHFVGGDKNAKIKISGGTVITPALGTLGAYYGYGRYVPNLTESEFVYSYGVIPKGTAITITGGSVEITENGYLGGMNASVTITGGSITLPGSATLGLTEAQTEALFNDASSRGELLTNASTVTVSGGSITGYRINTPYGSTSLSADAAASLAYLSAENGSITITSVADNYPNDYTGTDKVDHTVGVTVSETLSGLTVLIDENAVVYANKAYTLANGASYGTLTVTGGARLYTGDEYGSQGDGDSLVSKDGGEIYGNVRYTIVYELNGDIVDRATNDARNPADYLFSNETITLYDPTRPGYDFVGWYMEPDFSGTPFTTLTAATAKNQKIYAKWEPKKVRFLIEVSASVLGITAAELAEESIGFGVAGELSGSIFTFARVTEIAYLDNILGDGDDHINLKRNFALRSFTFSQIKVKDEEIYINGASTVTKDFVNRGTVTLSVAHADESRNELTLDLNLSNKRPIGAIFNNTASPDAMTSTTMSSYADYGKAISTANGFMAGGALVVPTAPGYLFMGWYDNKACTGEPITPDFIITPEGPMTFYAKWVAKDYYFAFDTGVNPETSEDNKITLDKTTPNASHLQRMLVLRIAYDRPLSSGVLTWVYEDGSFEAWTGVANLTNLPGAWVEGFTHNGAWAFTDKNGNEKKITLASEFNLTTLNTAIDWQDLTTDTSGTEPMLAIVLSPVITRTVVTYDPAGGSFVGIDDAPDWKNNYSSITEKNGIYTMQTAHYKKPLIGYTASVTASASYTLESTTLCPHGEGFSVVSTSVDYFKTNGYHENDYRYEIGKKGYTFKGWRLCEIAPNGSFTPIKDGSGNDILVGYLPQYEDIALQAVWEANVYDVTLKPYEQTKDDYHSAFNVSTDVHVGAMTIGNEITGLAPLWPDRASEWFAYEPDTTPEENQKRYLLGFTFDPLDPGVANAANAEGYAAYQKYASDVTTLLNNNAILTHSAGSDTVGSLFELPLDPAYGHPVVNGTNFVPDYPSGSSITLYAIYRERSLVFIEYYTDGEGDTHKRIMSSFPWDTWSDYADPNAESLGAYITRNDKPDDIGDYALIGWRFNASNITNTAYPATAVDGAGNYTVSPDDCRALYQAMLPELKREAEDLGTFDINVYSVWAAYQEISSATLENDTDPLADSSETVIDIAIPPSMQKGVLNHAIPDIPGLTLVDGAALNRFDSASGNNTVAIKATLYDENGIKMEETYLKEQIGTTDPKSLFTYEVEGNWRIVFRLYHASVVSESTLYSFSMTLGFEDDKLAFQRIYFDQVDLFMSPTLYTVDYEADLPTEPTEWNGFDSVTHHRVVENVPYGSPLLESVPTVTGYTANGVWESDSLSLDYGDDLIDDALAKAAVDGGEITLAFRTAWTINRYLFSADAALLARWRIFYGTARNELTSDTEINFNETVLFVPRTAGEYPEFVRLVRESESSLDLTATYNALEGGYEFSMPALDMQAFFNRLATLYLENGSIAITENGYTQAEAITWRGDYRILMNASNTAATPTANTLSLSGDLSAREITLGNLNIASKDAIALSDSATVSLTNEGLVTATNILVPENASLTLTGGSLDLTQSPDRACIGGDSVNGANGEITLDNVTVNLTLSQTYASGIGSGNASAGGNAITLRNVDLTVKETASSDVFRGAWIGGVGVTSVALDATTVALAAGSDEMLGPTVLEADALTITSSSLGSEANPLIDPIHAANTITITSSSLYQSLKQGVAIGTDGGVTEIASSYLQCDVIAPSALYTGQMILADGNADVTVAGVQLIETTHGDITITASGVTQGANTFLHTKNYLILHELANALLSDLTVEELTQGSGITLRTDLDALTVNADTPLTLDGNITVHGAVSIANEKTLFVTTDDTLTLASGFAGATNGCYRQNGGALSASTDLAIGGNLTLIGVVATVNGKLGSLGIGGVTTVTLTNSNVTADRIGALGAQNDTFTFVVCDNTTYTGTLVEDCFRLEYVIESPYVTSHLPKVLRAETTGGVTLYNPAIPDSPTGGAGFLFWYYKNGSSIVAIGYGADPSIAHVDSLTKALITYADTPNADSTRTLKIFAFMNFSIEGIIESGKLLNESDFANALTSVTLHASGKWTARFTVSGSVVSNAAYIVRFSTPVARGTKLTLGVMSEEIPTFYYYIVGENETEIALGDFIRMGSSGEKPSLLSAAAGSELLDILILSADFSEAEGSEDKVNTVTLAVVANGTTVSDHAVGYETEKFDSISSEKEGTASITHYGDTQFGGKMLYLIVTVNSNTALSYETALFVNNTEGARLSDTVFAVALSAAEEDFEEAVILSLIGAKGGYYSLGVSLALAERSSDNPLGHMLTETVWSRLTVEEEDPITLDVSLDAIDRGEAVSRILTEGVSHTLVFTAKTEGALSVTVGTPSEESGDMINTDYFTYTATEDGTVTVTVSDAAPKGSFVVLFSIDDTTDADDIAFTFLIN